MSVNLKMRKRKLIILLSAKRCGSTAVFNMFQKNKSVKIFHQNQDIDNWEVQFWSLGKKALNGNTEPFKKRMKECLPFVKIKKKLTKRILFEIMDQIFTTYGPVLFDKSPQYLGNKKAIDLLINYSQKKKIDLKIIGLIRDPKDALMSQYSLWKNYVKNDNLKRREKVWLKQYDHLEELKKKFKIPIFKYEDFSNYPERYSKKIFKYCGLSFEKKCIQHIKPISIGRFNKSILITEKKKWMWSEDFKKHLKKYNYFKDTKYKNSTNILGIFLNEMKSSIHPNLKKKIKGIIN